MAILLLALLLAVLHGSSDHLAAAAGSCPTKCGSLTIPYPFGISPGCGIPTLRLNCTASNSLLLPNPSQSLTLQVVNFTSSSLIINATSFKAESCNNLSGQFMFQLPKQSPFALSGNNRFFVNGCSASGSFSTDLSNHTVDCTTGCENDKPQYPFCNIYSCCVAPITTGARTVYIRGGGSSFRSGGCSFASMVYPPSYLTGDQYVIGSGTYGVELSFAAPGNCSSEENDGTLCSPNARCFDVPAIPGHVCECPHGFAGDGYVNGTGCLQVDGCLISGKACHKNARCSDHKCTCKAGFIGDGEIHGSGCTIHYNVAVVLGSFAATGGLLCVGTILFCHLHKRRERRKNIHNNMARYKLNSVLSSSGNGKPDHASLFSYKELERATKRFRSDLKLGTGGFGTVFKGTLYDGTVVAIKRANRSGSDQFLNEVIILSQVNHRNLVKLLGCCIDTEHPLLVYEYVSNGTLFEHLQGERGRGLSWDERLRIALETAEALAYLHSAAVPPIYHRDVKSANILLDENLTAKVADFGISKLVPITATHVSTAVQGTPGYLDPEYYQNYQLTDKTDVYSFGVVLLEIITGQKPVDFSRQSRDVNLAALSMPLIKKGRVEEIIDKRPSVSGQEMTTRIKRVAKLAVECLALNGDDRPGMKQVVEELLRLRGGWTSVGDENETYPSVESEYLVDGMKNIHDVLNPRDFSTRDWTSSNASGSTRSTVLSSNSALSSS